jgi:hypothetical protein
LMETSTMATLQFRWYYPAEVGTANSHHLLQLLLLLGLFSLLLHLCCC